MEALAAAVAPCKSGPALLACLRASSLTNSELPGLIAACIVECAAGKGAQGLQAAAPPAAPLGQALCTVPGLQFLTPRRGVGWRGRRRAAGRRQIT